MNNDQESQNDEILALKSIYEEDNILTFDETTRKGIFNVKINTTNTFRLNFGMCVSHASCM